jgi:hypothetical protein
VCTSFFKHKLSSGYEIYANLLLQLIYFMSFWLTREIKEICMKTFTFTYSRIVNRMEQWTISKSNKSHEKNYKSQMSYVLWLFQVEKGYFKDNKYVKAFTSWSVDIFLFVSGKMQCDWIFTWNIFFDVSCHKNNLFLVSFFSLLKLRSQSHSLTFLNLHFIVLLIVETVELLCYTLCSLR